MAANEQTSTSGDPPVQAITMVPIRRRRMFTRSDHATAADRAATQQSGPDSADEVVNPFDSTSEAPEGFEPVQESDAGLHSGDITPDQPAPDPAPGEVAPSEPTPGDAASSDAAPGDAVSDSPALDSRAPDESTPADPPQGYPAPYPHAEAADVASNEANVAGGGEEAPGSAAFPPPSGDDFYLSSTTPSYLSLDRARTVGVADEDVFAAADAAESADGPDDADGPDGYRPARMVRRTPGWEISKWLVVSIIALAFVVGSFLTIPALLEPASHRSPSAGANTTSAAPTTPPRAPYRDIVLAAAPAHYWQFAGSALANDEVGTAPLSIGGGVTYLGSSAVYGGTGSIDCAGTSNSIIVSTAQEAGLADFTIELWFSAATKDGGQLIGFSPNDAGPGGTDDRTVYMDRDGFLNFGVLTEYDRVAVRSDKQYNDSSWHHLAATKSGAVITLYLDGVPVGSEELTAAHSNLEAGYWRICGGSVSGWPRNGGNAQWAGSIDDVAVYPVPLPPEQVAAHHAAGV